MGDEDAKMKKPNLFNIHWETVLFPRVGSALEDAKMKEPNLFSIPWEDVLIPCVGSALSVKDCFNLRCVSKSAKLLAEEIIRKNRKLILYPSLFENHDTIQVLRKLCKNAHILTVAPERKYNNQKTTISSGNFIILTSGLKKLRYVDLAHCTTLSPQAVHKIFVNSKYMTYLNLSRCCWLTDGALHTLIVHQKHLKYVNLQCCCQLSSISLIKLVAMCPNLEKLSLQEVNAVNDTVLATIRHYCAKLKSLNLLLCEELSTSAIERFLSARPSVRVKQNKGCGGITYIPIMNLTYDGGNMNMPIGFRLY